MMSKHDLLTVIPAQDGDDNHRFIKCLVWMLGDLPVGEDGDAGLVHVITLGTCAMQLSSPHTGRRGKKNLGEYLGCKVGRAIGVGSRRRERDRRIGSQKRKFSPRAASGAPSRDWCDMRDSAWLRMVATFGTVRL